MSNQLSKNDLKWLWDQLKYDDIKRIAEECRYCPYTVNKFFKGEVYHSAILDSTLRLINKRKEVINRFNQIRNEKDL